MVQHSHSWLPLQELESLTSWSLAFWCVTKYLISSGLCPQFTIAVSLIIKYFYGWTFLKENFFLCVFNLDENDIAFHYLVKANKSNEKIWEFFMKYTAVSLIGLIMTCLVSIVYCYLICGHLNIDHFYRPGSYLYAFLMTYLWIYFDAVCIFQFALEPIDIRGLFWRGVFYMCNRLCVYNSKLDTIATLCFDLHPSSGIFQNVRAFSR